MPAGPNSYLLRRLAACLWAAVVAILLLSPGAAIGSLVTRLPGWLLPWVDKAVHWLLFAIQMWLVTLSAAHSRTLSRSAVGAVLGRSLVPTMLYALALELAQIWIPGRSWDLLDLAAGLVGAGSVALVLGITGRETARSRR